MKRVRQFLAVSLCLLYVGSAYADFQPTNLPSLLLWYKADTITSNHNDNISFWADQSGNTNDIGQTNATKYPIFVTNAVGGLPAVRFDSIIDRLDASNTLGGVTVGNLSIFAVYKNTASSNAVRSYGFGSLDVDGDASSKIHLNMASDASLQFDGGLIAGYSQTHPTDYFIRATFKNGTSYDDYFRGTNVLSGGSVVDGGIIDDFYIGKLCTGNATGDIAEIIVYTNVLSADDHNSVGYYLQNKYGLTGAYTAPPVPADLSTWLYKVAITSQYDRAETLTNFPMLVVLSTNIPGFEYGKFMDPAGGDLRFSDPTGITELSYEVEEWDTNGSSYVWVRVPQYTNNCVIWAYMGNKDETNPPAYTTNGTTWSQDYIGVWHMQSDVAALDSGPNGHDGAEIGNVEVVTTGIVANANSFDQDLDCWSIPDSTDFTLSGPYSVSAWIYSDPIGNTWEGFMGTYAGSGSPGFIFALQSVANNGLCLYSGGTWYYSLVAVPDDEWKYVTYTRNGGTGLFYIDGKLVATTGGKAGGNGTFMQLGAAGPSWSANRFDGMMDEARLSNIDRSSNWVWASWMNMASNSQFSSFGNVQLVPPSNLTVWVQQEQDLGTNSVTLVGRVISIGGAGNPEVYFCWGLSDAGISSTNVWPNVTYVGNSWGILDTFSNNISGLFQGSNYSYRCYVSNSTGVAWSDEAESFTTITLPVATNHGAAYGETTAVLAGEILATGDEAPAIWFYYWPDAGSTSVVAEGVQSGYLQTTVTGLTTSTLYHYNILASNQAGTVLTLTKDFTTLALGVGIDIYVSLSGSHDGGLSWSSAYNDLQTALDSASSNDTIHMAGQTFPLTTQIIWTVSGVTVRGGYEGVSASGPGANNPALWPTVIKRTGAAKFRVLSITGVTNVTLSDVTLRDGLLGSYTDSGGGLYIYNATNVNIISCTISDNEAGTSGGGIYVNNTFGVTIDNCLISNNVMNIAQRDQLRYGGGFCGVNSSGMITNCIISLNETKNTKHGSSNTHTRGGGLAFAGASASWTVVQSIIERNTVRYKSSDYKPLYGGGVYVANGTHVFRNCLIVTNDVISPVRGEHGEGAYISGGTLTLENCTVADNDGEGVQESLSGGTLVITNSIVFGHSADVVGMADAFYSCLGNFSVGENGCISNDPQFVDTVYYHLQSVQGHYTNGYFSGGGWSSSSVHSPAIDGCDPTVVPTVEPEPNGAILNMGAYGNTSVASLARPMALTNLAPNAVTPSSATINARLIRPGSKNVSLWFYWGLSDGTNNPAAWDSNAYYGILSPAGTFSTNVSGLLSGSNYYYTCFGSNSASATAWALPSTSFIAEVTAPELVNSGVLNEEGPTVTLQGEITSTGGEDPLTYICWGFADGGSSSTANWDYVEALGTQSGAFSTNITTLAGSNYFYTCYVTNSVGDTWAAPSEPFGHDKIRYVDVNASGLGNGYNWTDAFTAIDSALAGCSDAKTNMIYIRGGEYILSSQLNMTNSHIVFQGGCEGSGTPGNQDSSQWPTLIGREDAITTRLLEISNVDDCTLDSCTFSNAYLFGVGNVGGAVRIDTATNLTFRNCVIRDSLLKHTTGNGGGLYGGGIYSIDSYVLMTNCAVLDNAINTPQGSTIAWGYGGGIYIESGAWTITDSTISGNYAQTAKWSGGYGRGGGIYMKGNNRIFNCVFKYNETTTSTVGKERGHATFIASGTALIRNCLIADNLGGGHHSGGGVAVLENCTVVTNGLYGVRQTAGTLTVSNSIMWAQSTGDAAGTMGLYYCSIKDGTSAGSNGCTTNDPDFVDWTFYHLQSLYGHYTNGYFADGGWTTGSVNSSSIDACDPAIQPVAEPDPDGTIVNIGVYGNTPVASKSHPMALTNLAASAISTNGATLNAELLHMGSPGVHVWFYWGLSDGTNNAAAWDTNGYWGIRTTPGTVSTNVTGLLLGSNYFYTVFASNSAAATTWASPSTNFLIQLSPPVVQNNGATNENGPVVTLNGEITGTGGEDPQVYICWGPTEGSMSTGSWAYVIDMGTQNSTFSSNIMTAAGSNYFYTCMATNSGGAVWASPNVPFGHYRHRYVDNGASGGATGYNWSNAFTSIEAALADCAAGKTNIIYIKNGSYVRPSELSISSSHVLLKGGYSGSGAPGSLDPTGTTVITNLASSIRLMSMSGVDDITIENITFSGGDLIGDGGAINIANSTNVTISSCIMQANQTVGDGGAVHISGTTNLLIRDTIFSFNTATRADTTTHGGALSLVSSFGMVTNCLFERNSISATTSGDYSRGGAAYVSGSYMLFRDCILRYNDIGTRRAAGGALYTDGGSNLVKNCLITHNDVSASQGPRGGDGIYHNSGVLVVENCSVVGNDGEGINGVAAVSVRDSIIWQNNDDIAGSVSLANCDVDDGTSNGVNGCISSHPLFEYGFYLAVGSPCTNTGSRTVVAAGLTGTTTSTDGTPDGGTVDMGYHYDAGLSLTIADLYVSTGGNDGNSGTNSTESLRTITKALAQAAEGTIIHIAAGSYSNDLESFPLILDRSGQQLIGTNTALTIINAGGSGNAVRAWDVAFGRVENMTLTGGYLGTSTGTGGGIDIRNSDEFVLSSCIISNNESGAYGGGIYVRDSYDVLIDNCVVVDNNVNIAQRDQIRHGGGVHMANGSGVISNCFVRNNETKNTRYGSSDTRAYGGGVSMSGGTWALVYTVIEANNARYFSSDYKPLYGGGIYVANGTHTIQNCLIVTNRVISPGKGEYGDGAQVDGGTLVMQNCTIADNWGEGIRQGGGGVAAITNSIVWGNGDDVANVPSSNMHYSCIEDGDNNGTNGCVDLDPIFVDRTYYHLQSRLGHVVNAYFDNSVWAVEKPTSPLVDAGSTNAQYTLEPWPNGKRVNMGAYGNTLAASKADVALGTMLIFR